MRILCLPERMRSLRKRPHKDSKWIDITVNPISLKNMLDAHKLVTPEALLRKLWTEFRLSTETFDRIRIKIKKR